MQHQKANCAVREGFPPHVCLGIREKEMVTHSSVLAWRIPWAEEPGYLLPSGLIRKVHLQVAERPAGVQHRSHNGSDGGTNVTKVRKPALELTPCLWHSGAPWSLGIRNVP